MQANLNHAEFLSGVKDKVPTAVLALSPLLHWKLTIEVGENRVLDDSLVDQILAQPLHNLNLLLHAQTRNRHFQDSAYAGRMRGNEALVVKVHQRAHDELAIHTIGDTAVSWNTVTEILDLERAFNAGGEEAAEWSDQRRKFS